MTTKAELNQRDERVRELWLLGGQTPNEIAKSLATERLSGFTEGPQSKHAQFVYLSIKRIRESFDGTDIEAITDKLALLEHRERYLSRLEWLLSEARQEIIRTRDLIVTRSSGPKSAERITERERPNSARTKAMDVYRETAKAIARVRGVMVDEPDAAELDEDSPIRILESISRKHGFTDDDDSGGSPAN
jgi:hypothetical protein